MLARSSCSDDRGGHELAVRPVTLPVLKAS